jgi:hypothetical protein
VVVQAPLRLRAPPADARTAVGANGQAGAELGPAAGWVHGPCPLWWPVSGGGSSGSGRRGGNAAIDEVAASRARDYPRLFRPFDSGAAFSANASRIRFAGTQVPVAGDTGTGYATATSFGGFGFGNDRYFAIPDWFPRSGTIKRLSYFLQRSGLQVAARFQLHVYSNGTCPTAGNFLGFPYPDRLLLSGTAWTNPTAQGVLLGPTFHIYDSLTSYALADQTPVWFVLRCNLDFLSSGSKWALARSILPHWTGLTIGNAAGQANDVLTQGYGWTHTTTYTNGADSTFPSSAPALLPGGSNAVDAPAIGYGFAQD